MARSSRASQGRLALVEHPPLTATSCAAVWICTRVHGASAFCARELQLENYGKHLANSNRSTPLSESRARNLSSPEFVVWQQYGRVDRAGAPEQLDALLVGHPKDLRPCLRTTSRRASVRHLPCP